MLKTKLAFPLFFQGLVIPFFLLLFLFFKLSLFLPLCVFVSFTFFQCHLSAIYGQEEHQMAFYGYILVTKNTCVNQ